MADGSGSDYEAFLKELERPRQAQKHAEQQRRHAEEQQQHAEEQQRQAEERAREPTLTNT